MVRALADGFVRAQDKPVLVIAANLLSRRINPQERASATLFADAAGAVVLVPSSVPGTGILGADLASDGGHYGLISIPAGGSRRPFSDYIGVEETLMTISDGQEVFSQAVRMMTDCALRALSAAGLSAEDIDRFVPHQANARILDAVSRRLGLPPDRIVRTIEEYGNSSAATIPLSLSIARCDRAFAAGEQVLVTAAGAGLTGGAIVLGF